MSFQVADYNPMQMAVSAISDMNKRVRGPTGSKEEWLDSLNKNLEQEQKVRLHIITVETSVLESVE